MCPAYSPTANGLGIVTRTCASSGYRSGSLFGDPMPNDNSAYSGLILAAWITPAHFSVSAIK
jgi:hypothetical protein